MIMKNMISIVLLAGLIFTTISCHKKHSDKAELETTNSYFTYDGQTYPLKAGQIGSFDIIEDGPLLFSIALYSIAVTPEMADILPEIGPYSSFDFALFSETDNPRVAKTGEYELDGSNHASDDPLQGRLDFTFDEDIALFLEKETDEEGMVSSDDLEDVLVESGTINYQGKKDGKYELEFDLILDNGKRFKGRYEGAMWEFFD